jgi:hypothetical protein
MAAGDLTTLAAVKLWLNFTGTTDDPLLSSLITEVSAFVESTLNRKILTASYTETYRGTGGARFMLRNYPVQSVASIAWAGSTITTQADPVGTAAGVCTDGRSVILIGSTMPYNQPVKVTYTAGYDVVPADLALAVTELVGEAYTSRTHIGETSHSSSGATTVAFSREAMHKAILARLSNYMPGAPLC